MTPRFWPLVLSVPVLLGCAGSPAAISMKNPEELQAENTVNLCNAYHFLGDENAKKELIRRNAFTNQEWLWINNKEVGIGMGESAIVCAWGLPTKVNRTISRYGERKQWVFRRGYNAQYVYTEDGVVASIQG